MFYYVGLFDVNVYLIVSLLLDMLQCLRVCFSFVYAISLSCFLNNVHCTSLRNEFCSVLFC